MDAMSLNALQESLPVRVSKKGDQLVLEGVVLIRRTQTTRRSPLGDAGFLVYLDRELGTEQRVGDLRQEDYVVQPNSLFRFLR